MAIKAPDLIRMRQANQKIAMLTAYDYSFATLVDQSGIDVILVGDSLGTVVQGHETTLPVTLDEIIYHTRMVSRAAKRALVVADLPFMSYQVSAAQALESAGRLMKEGGAHAVKLEGGTSVCESVEKIVAAGIPVMGHIGLTPQSYHGLGGNKLQGRSVEQQEQLIAAAVNLEKAGAFAVVLEVIPASLAAKITAAIDIPTIGIGAGVECSGQVLVVHDLLAMAVSTETKPKFVREYAQVGKVICDAITEYVKDVKERKYPSLEESYSVPAKPTLELARG